MSWAEEVRLDFIDLLLLARGRVVRTDLVERFGISMSQASGDIRSFIQQYPDAMLYDRSAKCYVPATRRYRSVRGQSKRTIDALAQLAAAGSRLGWRDQP
ncbi:hypothetical protein RHODGE_RHODGE_03306 [Rhodoplanes serenus]|uniref:DNA-binding transcriptional repressor CapW winged helix-turn-helix domain-containing protein n=2 Tax=Nitrobacteraceae TaxID=41294 RepID=A0A447CXW2_9BRAD|nr:hypothetical protein RHODGE_RHODGE_03306 [Rhodoplanes serenus]